MFDVKDTDFFDMEDEAFDTIVENDISFTGTIKMKKAFMIRGKVNGKIDSTSDLVIDSDAVVNADYLVGESVKEPGCIFTGKCSMVRNENEK